MPKTPMSPILRFTPEAQALSSDDLRISVPFHVLLGEAADVAKFFAKYFGSLPAQDGQPARPGLDTALNPDRKLTADTGKDIVALLEATQSAQTRYQMASSPRGAAPMDRGRAIVDEISAVLEWHFDDGIEDERDAQLAAVAQAHESTPDSADALAAEIEDYARLAAAYRAEIDGLGGFDAKILDEAPKVAADLRDRPAMPVPMPEETRRALALRNRLATLLSDRLSLVRSAARFVFRNHPDIVREATSAYERRRRAASRRTAAKKTPEAAAPQPK